MKKRALMIGLLVLAGCSSADDSGALTGLPIADTGSSGDTSGGDSSTGVDPMEGSSDSTTGAELPPPECGLDDCFNTCAFDREYDRGDKVCTCDTPGLYESWSCGLPRPCEMLSNDSSSDSIACALEAIRTGTAANLEFYLIDLEPSDPQGSSTEGRINVLEPGIALISLTHGLHCCKTSFQSRAYTSRRLQVRPATDPWWDACLPDDGPADFDCLFDPEQGFSPEFFPFLLGTCDESVEPSCG